MAAVTAAMVKELRERTQAGMSDCKNALVEADADMEKAVEIILKKGIVKAAARAGRVASEGEVRAVITAEGRRGTILEVNCQTDFVSRGDDFRGFVAKVTEVAVTAKAGTDLLTLPFPGAGKTVDQVRQEMVAKTGENTLVRRWDVIEAKGEFGYLQAYIHMGGKLGVILSAEAPTADAHKSEAFRTFIENCAMQVAAMNPMVVSKSDLAQHDIDKQREIYEAQLQAEGKPEKAWPKIIEGKLGKWYTEITLIGQDRVWQNNDDDKGSTIEVARQELSKALGGEVKLVSFLRYALGEGIEKKKDDLAAEVAKMAAS